MWAPNVNEWMSSCEFILVSMFFSLFKNGRKNSKVRSKLLAWWWRTFQHFFIESLKSSDGERATNDEKKICEILLKHIFIACVIKAVFSPNHITIIIICASISPALDCYQYVGSYQMDHTHTSTHFDVCVRFFSTVEMYSWKLALHARTKHHSNLFSVFEFYVRKEWRVLEEKSSEKCTAIIHFLG